MRRKKRGLFIALEGIDGSGKSTQSKFLRKSLRKAGYEVSVIDFPQYGKKSSGPVEEYLSGAYGTSREVGPYRASVLFAVDRYDASFAISRDLEKGKIVIADRYVGSNMGHQGGKIREKKKRREFFRWLYHLEYEIFQVPKPDISFFLHMPFPLAKKLCASKAHRRKRKSDIHEKSIEHLKNAEASYQEAVTTFPKDFRVIESAPRNRLQSVEEVNERLWERARKLL